MKISSKLFVTFGKIITRKNIKAPYFLVAMIKSDKKKSSGNG